MPSAVGEPEAVAEAILKDLTSCASGTKRLRLRSLLKKFGFVKRSDRNTAAITSVLDARRISINPPIIRLGDAWELGYEDWVYLSAKKDSSSPAFAISAASALPADWNMDGWFDRVLALDLRTEKEVEIKFIVPMLRKLGYADEDRYDGMPVPAAHGSRSTTLVIDFAVFNSQSETLRNQPLLTVEAKHETRIRSPREIMGARNQARSYCLWTQCDYFVVTDGQTVEVFDLTRPLISGSCGVIWGKLLWLEELEQFAGA